MPTITETTIMKLSTRFGEIEYSENDIIHFPEGLVGFSKLRKFVLVCTKEGSHFRWLQSIDEGALAFLVADPAVYVPEYEPTVSESMVRVLELEDETPRFLFTTVSIPHGHPEDMTLNLLAPIVINAATRKAKQLVLDDQAYTIKHRVFQAADRSGEKQVA